VLAHGQWGTPARQNSWQLPNLRQYLVPFACTADQSSPNTLLRMHRFANAKDDADQRSFVWNEEEREWRAQLSAAANSDPAAAARAFADAQVTWPAAFASSAAAAPSSLVPQPSFPVVYPKRFQILVWGKEARYFEGLGPLLRALAEVAPLLTVVMEDGRRHFPAVGDLPPQVDAGQSFPRIRHLGVLDSSTLAGHVRSSALLLGVGDPILSFTPMEALQVGTPWLNPRFQPAKTFWNNGDCRLTSQNQYAEAQGAPRVWNYPLGDAASAASVARRALQWVAETQGRLGGVPPMYPRELHFDRLVARLNDNFRADFCAEAGLPPTPAHAAVAP